VALTDKGKNALNYIKQYFPTGAFSAKDLSDACGEKIFAATLNGVVNNGYLNKIGGSPVQYEAVNDLNEILSLIEQEEEKKGITKATLEKAKKQKNDEFYTRYEDIEDEVMKYRKYFKNKIVYLPCDDPANKQSEFWSFFVNNFDAFGLKKLIATHYDENGKAYKIWIEDDTTGDGYIDDGDAFQEDLHGNGDFRSPECVEILNECDIVCTNPPFSLFRDFVDWIFTAKKQFLIIGNNNAITYKEIFPLIKSNQMWVGYTANKTCIFRVGEGYTYDESTTQQINDGNYYGKVPAITWFTNLPNTKRNEEMILTASYALNPDKYPKYDNYDGINVDRLVDIPKDYQGVMGVPITIIDKYNPNQFEIIKFRKGDDEKDLRYGGKEPYFRVLVRLKK
jgi:hypothetical protein